MRNKFMIRVEKKKNNLNISHEKFAYSTSLYLKLTQMGTKLKTVKFLMNRIIS